MTRDEKIENFFIYVFYAQGEIELKHLRAILNSVEKETVIKLIDSVKSHIFLSPAKKNVLNSLLTEYKEGTTP